MREIGQIPLANSFRNVPVTLLYSPAASNIFLLEQYSEYAALHLKINLILPNRFVGTLEMVVDAQIAGIARKIVFDCTRHLALGGGYIVLQRGAGANFYRLTGVRHYIAGEINGYRAAFSGLAE